MNFVAAGLGGAVLGLGGGLLGLVAGRKKKQAAKPEEGLALLQRREMADADAERKKLLQEKASIVGRRRRGAGLSTYSGAY